jgi:hypothetical protein
VANAMSPCTSSKIRKRKAEVLTFSSGDTKMRCVVVMYRVPAAIKKHPACVSTFIIPVILETKIIYFTRAEN